MTGRPIGNVLITELHYLPMVIIPVVLGVLVMEYLLGNERFMRAVAPLGRWLTKASNLPDTCAVPFIISFASPSMAPSMLATMYRDCRLSRSHLEASREFVKYLIEDSESIQDQWTR